MEHVLLGQDLRASGNLDAARKEFERAIEIVPKHLRAYFEIAETCRQLGRPAEALSTMRKAKDTWEQLAWEQPDSPESQSAVATSQLSIGNMFAQLGGTAGLSVVRQSLGDLRKARSIRSEPRSVCGGPCLDVRCERENTGSRESAERSPRNLQENSGDPRATAGHIPTSIRTSATWPGITSSWATSWNRRARKAEALQTFEKALAVNENFVRLLPGSGQADDALVGIHDTTSALLKRMGRTGEVLQSTQKSLSIRERRTRAHPDSLIYRNDLAAAYQDIGNILAESGRKTEAVQSFQKALAVYERLDSIFRSAKLNPRMLSSRCMGDGEPGCYRWVGQPTRLNRS